MTEASADAGVVLIVDDDADQLRLLRHVFETAGHRVIAVTAGEAALAQLRIAAPDLVVTDLYMEGMDGMELLARIHRLDPLLPVIMLSGQASIPDAVRATHLGTSAFLTKPIDRAALLAVAAQCLRLRRPANRSLFDTALIHCSTIIDQLIDQAVLVAQSDVTVFITGETGTGKEVLAKAIHAASARAEKPYIGVNCGAIPEQLLESELFGHEKGAFTGAAQRHTGLFQAADGGTLLLDEIGDMPLGLQVKLLRVLQDFEVRPVGSVTPQPINVRIIAATHQDLDQLVRTKVFREDLYYRLNVVPLQMPSLAERREDIPLLLDQLLDRHAARTGQPRKRFAPDAIAYLTGVAWPGNVRQLANAVAYCATLTPAEIIPESVARRALREAPAGIETLKEARDAFERKYLVNVLRVTGGQVAEAARISGRNRTEFYKLLHQHGIDATAYRGGSESTPPRNALASTAAEDENTHG
jgi:two-component system response regulator GlrR